MLTGCAGFSGNTEAPTVAMVPKVYIDGCKDPAIAAGNSSKVNAARVAAAYGACKALQKDTVSWTTKYLFDLGGRS